MPEPGAGIAEGHINEEELVRRFEEKKRLLESAGGKPETKDVFREVFRTHAAEKLERPQAPVQATEPPVSRQRDDIDDDALRSLVSLALEKGIASAVKKAEAETPYLVDALHDELADHYYEKLIASGKLRPE